MGKVIRLWSLDRSLVKDERREEEGVLFWSL